jgi:hypothetical protein
MCKCDYKCKYKVQVQSAKGKQDRFRKTNIMATSDMSQIFLSIKGLIYGNGRHNVYLNEVVLSI